MSDVQAQTQYDDLVCSYFTGNTCQTALRIMWCESKGYERAYSAGNYGLFQINQIHSARLTRLNLSLSDLYDPEINVAIAYQLYTERGWQHWRACL